MERQARDIDVSYHQITVFATSVEAPFSSWTQRHVDQGFVWRTDSVSFATKVDGRHLIRVEKASDKPAYSANAFRIIEVPFEVPEIAEIEIASISDAFTIKVDPGRYLLRYELSTSAAGDLITLTFVNGIETRCD